MEINYLNLKRIFNYILENVPEDMIIMYNYRLGSLKSHECESAGCIIGHSVILDDWNNIPKLQDESIDFRKWSEQFIGLDDYDNKWRWCFSAGWPNGNKEQILLRLKYLIDNQKLPDDWDLDEGHIFISSFNYDYLLPVTDLTPYKL